MLNISPILAEGQPSGDRQKSNESNGAGAQGEGT